MTTQHTPGPWRAEFSSMLAKGRRRFSLESVSAHKWFGDLYLTETISDAEQDANARLIAAAPALLAAAKWALAYLDTSDMPFDEQKKRNALADAIVQAEGRTG